MGVALHSLTSDKITDINFDNDDYSTSVKQRNRRKRLINWISAFYSALNAHVLFLLFSLRTCNGVSKWLFPHTFLMVHTCSIFSLIFHAGFDFSVFFATIYQFLLNAWQLNCRFCNGHESIMNVSRAHLLYKVAHQYFKYITQIYGSHFPFQIYGKNIIENLFSWKKNVI